MGHLTRDVLVGVYYVMSIDTVVMRGEYLQLFKLLI